jgi:hypothetical protein
LGFVRPFSDHHDWADHRARLYRHPGYRHRREPGCSYRSYHGFRNVSHNAALLATIASDVARHLGLVSRWCGKTATRQRKVSISRAAFVVAPSNRKTIGFFTAFLPQFVAPHLAVAPQLLVMCIVSALLAALSDSLWAITSGFSRGGKPARAELLGRLLWAVLIGGGIWLSLTRART